jgi:hypothetical protein
MILWDAMQKIDSTKDDEDEESETNEVELSVRVTRRAAAASGKKASRSHSNNSQSSSNSNNNYDVTCVPLHELDLRLLGVACLHMASKAEDCDGVDVGRLLSAAWSYDPAEVFAMEQRVLVSLGCNLSSVPLLIDFLGCYLWDPHVRRITDTLTARVNSNYSLSEEIYQLSLYVSEVSLFFDRFKSYRTSLLARSVVALVFDVLIDCERDRGELVESIESMHGRWSDDDAELITRCKEELRHCVMNIHSLFKHVGSVYKKYSSETRCCVAAIVIDKKLRSGLIE